MQVCWCHSLICHESSPFLNQNWVVRQEFSAIPNFYLGGDRDLFWPDDSIFSSVHITLLEARLPNTSPCSDVPSVSWHSCPFSPTSGSCNASKTVIRRNFCVQESLAVPHNFRFDKLLETFGEHCTYSYRNWGQFVMVIYLTSVRIFSSLVASQRKPRCTVAILLGTRRALGISPYCRLGSVYEDQR